jgi:hypothetical protein
MENAINLRKSRLSRAYEYLRYNGYIKTQRDLAEVMHTAPPNISNAMRGSDKVLTNGFLVRLNSAFNGIFNENWLLYGEGDMLANPQPNDKCLINASLCVLMYYIMYYTIILYFYCLLPSTFALVITITPDNRGKGFTDVFTQSLFVEPSNKNRNEQRRTYTDYRFGNRQHLILYKRGAYK